MSVTTIPEKVKFLLWGKSAGRCEYDGCNKELYKDELTKCEFNNAYIAHIVADSPNGPRGDQNRSGELAKDINNLMLLCDEHHRLIDKEQVQEHTEERLLAMKKKHEERIKLLASIKDEKKSNVILYGANIGELNINLNWRRAAEAIVNDGAYPAESYSVELGLKNSVIKDENDLYWKIEEGNLEGLFNSKIKVNMQLNEVNRYSIFALAPQPLLIKLGSLFSDIYPADVYQLHREPANWLWQEFDDSNFEYRILRDDKTSQNIAVNLSLSANIDNLRIKNVVEEDVAIWTIKIDNPNNDYLKSKNQLLKFRQAFRSLLDEIKFKNPKCTSIKIFPAVPVAIAVEIGRVWMPKADLPLEIYDENRKKGGFNFALTIR